MGKKRPKRSLPRRTVRVRISDIKEGPRIYDTLPKPLMDMINETYSKAASVFLQKLQELKKTVPQPDEPATFN